MGCSEVLQNKFETKSVKIQTLKLEYKKKVFVENFFLQKKIKQNRRKWLFVIHRNNSLDRHLVGEIV